jgi:hypothetical protein
MRFPRGRSIFIFTLDNRNRLLLGMSCLASLAMIGCSAANEDLPGTALGTFDVAAVRRSNTCGAGTKSVNPWKFEAELSLDSSTLYFRRTGDDAMSGALDSDMSATMTRVTNGVQTTEASSSTGCDLSRKEVFEVQLDSADAPQTASGSLIFTYSEANGDCSSELARQGGVFDELPCTIEYTYTALKQ